MSGIDLKNVEVKLEKLGEEFVRKLSEQAKKKVRETFEQIGIKFEPKTFKLTSEKTELNHLEIKIVKDEEGIQQCITSAQGKVTFLCECNGKTTKLEMASVQGIAPVSYQYWQAVNLGKLLELFAPPLNCAICGQEIPARYIERKSHSGIWKLIPRDSKNNRLLKIRFPFIEGVANSLQINSYFETKGVTSYPSALVVCPKCQPKIKQATNLEELSNFAPFVDIKETEFFESLKNQISIKIKFEEA